LKGGALVLGGENAPDWGNRAVFVSEVWTFVEPTSKALACAKSDAGWLIWSLSAEGASAKCRLPAVITLHRILNPPLNPPIQPSRSNRRNPLFGRV
jgi:hypothetical protein